MTLRPTIYTVDAMGALTAMLPSAPRSEDFMQTLVARHPELISDQDGALLLIRREQPIADGLDAGGRWSLDHLFVTRAGVPVLVELKRAIDTRLRREVVGQMLDYAANAAAYWQAGRVAAAFAATAEDAGEDANAVLASFLSEGQEPDEFWQQVDGNFAAGRLKLVFVADTIPRELARIVEFLNEQMKADVRAVELAWFESAETGVTALSPRFIGETERAQTAKQARAALPPIGREEWIAQHLSTNGAATIAGAEAFIALMEELGGEADVTSTQGSIYAAFDLPQDRLIPVLLSRYSKGAVQLCLGYLKARAPFATDEKRLELYERLAAFAGPLSTRTLSGFPGFPVTRLNEPEVRDGLRKFLRDLLEEAGATGS